MIAFSILRARRGSRLASSEKDAGGVRHGIDVTGGFEYSGLWGSVEDGNLIGKLLSQQERVAIGREGEMAGFLASEVESTDERQGTTGPDAKRQEFIGGSPIAGIKDAPRLVDDDLASAIGCDVPARWQCWCGRHERKGSLLRIPGKLRQGRIE